MKNKSLVSINDFTREEHIRILELAGAFEKRPKQRILEDYVVATLFFEPSTRTRLSFESAATRLGARVIGFTALTIGVVTILLIIWAIFSPYF